MARPKDMKRPCRKDYNCSENEKYNLKILLDYYNTVGGRIYAARILNHLIYDECVRVGLSPKPCVEETLLREKEVIEKPKKVKKIKKEPKKISKKQQEAKELDERLSKILDI